jgi:large subunit ribosomal protein L30
MQSKNIDPGAKIVRVTYIRSSIGLNKKQKATVKALGLNRLGDSIEKSNTPAVRGMIDHVGHLVSVEVVE